MSTYAPIDPGEMGGTTARKWRKLIREVAPALKLEVWVLAQGKAYLIAKGPTPWGEVDVSLRCESECASFLNSLFSTTPPWVHQ